MKRFLHLSLFAVLFSLAAATAAADGFPFGNIGLGIGTNAACAQIDVGDNILARGSIFIFCDADKRFPGDVDPITQNVTNEFWYRRSGARGLYVWNNEQGLVPAITPTVDGILLFSGLPIKQDGSIGDIGNDGLIYLGSEEKGIIWADGGPGNTVFAKFEPRPWDDPPRFFFQVGDSAFYLSASGVEAAE